MSTSRQDAVGTRKHSDVFPERARRLLNIIVALIGIVISAPLMLLVALLIKLESSGPAIYKQPRVGLDRRRNDVPSGHPRRRRCDLGGRVFTMYKFRTMVTHYRPQAQTWAARHDLRVTRVGRSLRSTHLDELPQLFNVIKGDMNIVGPRPEQPQIFSELRDVVLLYPERQKVLPGITGLAQVKRGYDMSLDDVRKKVELDLEYIRGRSAVKDLTIMVRTLPVMANRRVWHSWPVTDESLASERRERAPPARGALRRDIVGTP
ncbi:MAG TPA: sugar transferase [Longimicrobiales bacterium]|nr:sugar transferase [Longimicrobiales bacterium]